MSTLESPAETVRFNIHRGECPLCGSSKKWGEEIMFSTESESWVHANCPEGEWAILHGTCDKCWMAFTPMGTCNCG